MDNPAVLGWECTCESCPEQYEGLLVDGRWFYFRYRFGRAELGLGDTLDAAVWDSIGRRSVRVGDKYDGRFIDEAQRNRIFDALLLEATRG